MADERIVTEIITRYVEEGSAASVLSSQKYRDELVKQGFATNKNRASMQKFKEELKKTRPEIVGLMNDIDRLSKRKVLTPKDANDLSLYRRRLSELVRDMGSLGAAADRAAGAVKRNRKELENNRREVERLRKEMRAAEGAYAVLGRTIDRVTRTSTRRAISGWHEWATTLATIVPPLLIQTLTVLAGAVTSVGAAAVEAAASLQPLLAGIGAFPALASAGVQVLATWKIAMQSFKKATQQAFTESSFNKFLSDISGLAPAAQGFAIVVRTRLKPAFDQIQKVTQQNIFGGMVEAISALLPRLPLVKNAFAGTSKAIGDFIAKFGRELSGPTWARAFQTQTNRNIKTITALGNAFLPAARAIRDLTLASGPLVTWLTNQASAMADSAASSIAYKKRTGELAKEVNGATDRLKQFVSIGKDGFGIIKGILGGAQGGANSLIGQLGGALHSWNQSVGSAAGQIKIRQFFTSIQPSIKQSGLLIEEVAKDIVKLGQEGGFANLAAQLRTKFLPALTQVGIEVSRALGGRLVTTLTDILTLLANMSAPNGPVHVLLLAVDGLAKSLNFLFSNSFTKGIATFTLGFLGIYRVFRLLGGLVLTRFIFDAKGWTQQLKNLTIGREAAAKAAEIDALANRTEGASAAEAATKWAVLNKEIMATTSSRRTFLQEAGLRGSRIPAFSRTGEEIPGQTVPLGRANNASMDQQIIAIQNERQQQEQTAREQTQAGARTGLFSRFPSGTGRVAAGVGLGAAGVGLGAAGALPGPIGNVAGGALTGFLVTGNPWGAVAGAAVGLALSFKDLMGGVNRLTDVIKENIQKLNTVAENIRETKLDLGTTARDLARTKIQLKADVGARNAFTAQQLAQGKTFPQIRALPQFKQLAFTVQDDRARIISDLSERRKLRHQLHDLTGEQSQARAGSLQAVNALVEGAHSPFGLSQDAFDKIIRGQNTPASSDVEKRTFENFRKTIDAQLTGAATKFKDSNRQAVIYALTIKDLTDKLGRLPTKHEIVVALQSDAATQRLLDFLRSLGVDITPKQAAGFRRGALKLFTDNPKTQNKAGGGRVTDGSPLSDSVPALLSKDEFVVTGGGEKMLEQMTFPGVLDWLGGVQPRHFGAGGRAVQRFVAGGSPTVHGALTSLGGSAPSIQAAALINDMLASFQSGFSAGTAGGLGLPTIASQLLSEGLFSPPPASTKKGKKGTGNWETELAKVPAPLRPALRKLLKYKTAIESGDPSVPAPSWQDLRDQGELALIRDALKYSGLDANPAADFSDLNPGIGKYVTVYANKEQGKAAIDFLNEEFGVSLGTPQARKKTFQAWHPSGYRAGGRVGFARGGRGGLLARTQRLFPGLGEIVKRVALKQSGRAAGHGSELEFYPKGESWSFDPSRPAIQTFGKVSPRDVAGDLVSHWLGRGANKKLTGYYNRFEGSLTPFQMSKLHGQYQWARTHEHERRPYKAWAETSGIPAFFRGYAFNQWPGHDSWYTKAQRKDLNSMMRYLHGGSSRSLQSATLGAKPKQGESPSWWMQPDGKSPFKRRYDWATGKYVAKRFGGRVGSRIVQRFADGGRPAAVGAIGLPAISGAGGDKANAAWLTILNSIFVQLENSTIGAASSFAAQVQAAITSLQSQKQTTDVQQKIARLQALLEAAQFQVGYLVGKITEPIQHMQQVIADATAKLDRTFRRLEIDPQGARGLALTNKDLISQLNSPNGLRKQLALYKKQLAAAIGSNDTADIKNIKSEIDQTQQQIDEVNTEIFVNSRNRIRAIAQQRITRADNAAQIASQRLTNFETQQSIDKTAGTPAGNFAAAAFERSHLIPELRKSQAASLRALNLARRTEAKDPSVEHRDAVQEAMKDYLAKHGELLQAIANSNDLIAGNTKTIPKLTGQLSFDFGGQSETRLIGSGTGV